MYLAKKEEKKGRERKREKEKEIEEENDRRSPVSKVETWLMHRILR